MTFDNDIKKIRLQNNKIILRNLFVLNFLSTSYLCSKIDNIYVMNQLENRIYHNKYDKSKVHVDLFLTH